MGWVDPKERSLVGLTLKRRGPGWDDPREGFWHGSIPKRDPRRLGLNPVKAESAWPQWETSGRALGLLWGWVDLREGFWGGVGSSHPPGGEGAPEVGRMVGGP